MCPWAHGPVASGVTLLSGDAGAGDAGRVMREPAIVGPGGDAGRDEPVMLGRAIMEPVMLPHR